MIEIGGFIHQLNIREAQKENDYCPTVFITESNKKRSNPADKKNKICVITNWFYPIKTVITKEKIRFNV